MKHEVTIVQCVYVYLKKKMNPYKSHIEKKQNLGRDGGCGMELKFVN